MDHVAIMKKSWGLIPKILSGEKSIESRWYQTRRAPWNKIQKGETVYFKNSGESISAKANVLEVMQFEIGSMHDLRGLVDKYADPICMINRNPDTWKPMPNYCILIRLENPKQLTPFNIDKTGYGSAAAWLCVEDIKRIAKQV
jgi:hypothetical protein